MEILPIVAIIFFATVFRTTFGFGEALISVPILALIIPIQIAAPLAVLVSILVAAFVVARDWRHIHFKSAGWLTVSTFFGIPFGLILLKTAPEPAVKTILAILILVFCFHSLVFPPEQLSLKDDGWAWIFGFIAGVCGGSYGVNGPPLAIYGSLRRWSPDRFRATLQGYFLPASLVGMIGYALTGLWTKTVTTLFAWSLPAIVAGIFIGRIAARKINAKRFEHLVRAGLILVAIMLLIQTNV